MSKAEEFKDYEELIKNIPDKDCLCLALLLLAFGTSKNADDKSIGDVKEEVSDDTTSEPV